MGLGHYLILGAAGLLILVAIFPTIGKRAGAVVPYASPRAPLRSAFEELRDVATGLAYQRIETEIADRQAAKLKAEIQDLFAPSGAEGEAKNGGP